MKTTMQWAFAASCFTLMLTTTGLAADLLSPDDFIIAIDTDSLASGSSYPDAEAPIMALDSDSATKYLNFGKLNTGFIVSPSTGSTTVQSIQLTTANDAVERDPTSWKLYGTNYAITSVDNGDGSQENWTLIAEDNVTLSDTRFTKGPVQSFVNAAAYTSYRMLIPTVKDEGAANSMQIADVDLFTSNDGTGLGVWDDLDTPIAFQLPTFTADYPANEGPTNILDGSGPTDLSHSSYPAAESPANAVDGTLAKYLNFGQSNSGFIVTPTAGPSQVQSFQLTTANDAADRDPFSWTLYGTNEPIASADNSLGIGESWTLIDSGSLSMPIERDTLGDVISVNNAGSYNSYKMLFPEVYDPSTVNSMQIAEASFFASTDGTGADLLNAGDPILAIDADVTMGTATKYLNFGKENSGFIITPSTGSTLVEGFQITTANDADVRDPASWALYGTDDPITSADKSQGTDEDWTLIDSGTFDMALEVPVDRETAGSLVAVTSATAYSSYRMVFPTLRDTLDPGAVGIQLSGIQFFGEAVAQDDADFDGDGDIDGNDFLTWQAGLGLTGQTGNDNGDANGDGVVDAADLVVWKSQFGSLPMVSASAAVPEPATAVLVFFGMIVAFSGVRRHNA